MEEKQAIQSLAALAQEVRLRAFRALVVAGQDGMTPTALAEALGVAANTLSFHLKELAHADLVTPQRQGRHLIYRASFPAMNGLLAYLTENCCQGRACDVSQTPIQRTACPACLPSHPMNHSTPALNVLFLCTHNSARSILAEALLNALGQGRFVAHSAGSSPRAQQKPHPFGLQVLEKAGVPTQGLRSKSWDEFAIPGAPSMDLIITVCDNAAGETCPVWPGHPATAHWGFADPSAGEASDEEKLEAFRKTMHLLKRRLELLVNLPPEKLANALLQTTARELAQA